MFCEIFFSYGNKNWNELIVHLNAISQPYRIITTNDKLHYHLKKIGKDSKTFQEIYPDPDPITMKTAENARDTVKKYEECTMGLLFNNFKVFYGMENILLFEAALLEKAKKILETKKSTIFIFEGFSLTYFSILKLSLEMGYVNSSNELKIGYFNEQKIDYLTPKNNSFILEKKEKLNLIRNYIPTLSTNTSKNKISLTFFITRKIISMIQKSFKLQFLNFLKIDPTLNILKQIDNKISFSNVKYFSKTAFFLTADVELPLTPLYPLLEKFDESNERYQIFSPDPITSSYLQKKNIPFIELFEEIYLLSNFLKNSNKGKKLNQQIKECAIKNNLSLLYFEKIAPSILDKIYQYVATTIIIEHIVDKMKLQCVVTCDATPFANGVASVMKKHNITTFEIIAAHLEYHPHFTKLKADKLCVPGRTTEKTLIDVGIHPDRIIITGNPKFDYVKSVNYSQLKLFLENNYHIDKKKKLISIIMSRWHKNDEVWLAKFIEFCNKNDFEIIIKPHPRYKVSGQETDSKIEYIKKECKNKKFLITFDLDLSTIIGSSDLVISDFSSSILEAILLEKPVITVNFIKDIIINAVTLWHKFDLAVHVEKYDELENSVLCILNGNNLLEKFKNARIKTVPDFNHLNDGQATVRLFNLLKEKITPHV